MAQKQRWLSCFVAHRLELLISASWQAAPRPLRKVMERLEIEHLRHGGLNNGHLYVSFTQFVECGVSRKRLKNTLRLGEQMGLIEVIQDEATIRGDIRPPNRYRLTYVPAKNKNAPTDEWKSITKERADALVEAFTEANKRGISATRREAA